MRPSESIQGPSGVEVWLVGALGGAWYSCTDLSFRQVRTAFAKSPQGSFCRGNKPCEISK
jgi:hypothetical protein